MMMHTSDSIHSNYEILDMTDELQMNFPIQMDIETSLQ
jgi:hypothetical protein